MVGWLDFTGKSSSEELSEAFGRKDVYVTLCTGMGLKKSWKGYRKKGDFEPHFHVVDPSVPNTPFLLTGKAIVRNGKVVYCGTNDDRKPYSPEAGDRRMQSACTEIENIVEENPGLTYAPSFEELTSGRKLAPSLLDRFLSWL